MNIDKAQKPEGGDAPCATSHQGNEELRAQLGESRALSQKLASELRIARECHLRTVEQLRAQITPRGKCVNLGAVAFDPATGEVKEILPCPFCGDERAHANEEMDGFGSWTVSCLNCCAEVLRDSREEAIAAWNRRKKPMVAPAQSSHLKCSWCGAPATHVDENFVLSCSGCRTHVNDIEIEKVIALIRHEPPQPATE